jgi:hypothetical protein
MELQIIGAILIAITVITYLIALRWPVSRTMRWLAWMLILPASILPSVLSFIGVLNMRKGVNIYFIVTPIAAFCIAVGAAFALRIGKVYEYERYTLLGVISAIVAPLFPFFMLFWGFIA